jgi:hypothetical protein
MFSKIVLGIDVILYGLAHLSKLGITMTTFYWGLVVLGVVYLLELLYADRSRFHRPANTQA